MYFCIPLTRTRSILIDKCLCLRAGILSFCRHEANLFLQLGYDWERAVSADRRTS